MDENQPNEPDLDLLTARQREVWELRHSTDPPMIFKEIAERLDVKTTSAWRAYARAKEVLGSGVPTEEAQRRGRSRGGKATSLARREEVVNPELGAKVMDYLANPLNDNVAEIGRDLGIPQATMQHIMERVNRDYLPLSRKLGEVRSSELRDLMGLRAYEILASISRDDIAEASLKDKMIAAGIATDKHQLLSGQPTEIFSIPQLENLDRLAAILSKHAEKHGRAAIIDPETQQARVLPSGDDG